MKSFVVLVTMSLLVGSTVGCSHLDAGNCAGWRKVSLKAPTVTYLVKNDRPAAEGILGNNEHGVSVKCWEPNAK